MGENETGPVGKKSKGRKPKFGEKLKRVEVHLPVEMVEAMDRECKDKHISRSALVRREVNEGLAVFPDKE